MTLPPDQRSWHSLARAQEGILSRAQLRAARVDHWRVRNQVEAGRWVVRSSTVISTTTGPLSPQQLRWLAVLHAGPHALLAGLTVAEDLGLRSWHRDEITVLVPHDNAVNEPLRGVELVRTRRDLRQLRSARAGVPSCRPAPALLLWASMQRSERTARGVLAASVQQRLVTPQELLDWVDRLRPLRKAPLFRRALAEMTGGAQSLAEMDVARMCRRHGLALPRRQVPRRDGSGRLRFTDAEWRLPDGRVLVLEVDGGFHMEVEHWEDDIARQRALTSPDRLVVRATAREVRDEAARVARDLRLLGVPTAA